MDVKIKMENLKKKKIKRIWKNWAKKKKLKKK